MTNICEESKKYFGLTEDANKAGFILADGSMLDFSGGTEERIADHSEVKFVGAKNVNDFMEKCSAIRFHHSRYKPPALNIDISNKKLTKDQEKRVGDILKNRFFQTIFLDVEKPIPKREGSFIGCGKVINEPTLEKLKREIDVCLEEVEK